MIEIDKTLFVQVVVFLAFAFLMNRFAFKPFLRFLEQRHRRIFGAKEEAERLKEEAERLARAYEEELKRHREEIFRERVVLREEAKREREAKLEALKEEIHAQVEGARQKIRQEAERAMRDLEALCEDLAIKVAERLLGRPLN